METVACGEAIIILMIIAGCFLEILAHLLLLLF